MKKLLFIILALSTIVIYATDQNIENEIGEKLKVDIKFTLPREIIKYVIYAEKNGIKEEKLNLPDFIMSQDSSKAGFIESPPKIYVKRIINGKIENLGAAEKVTYILNHADGFMPIALTDKIVVGTISRRQITSYLAKTTLENIVKNSGINGYSVGKEGSIEKTGTSPLLKYFPAAQINMKNNNNILEITSPPNKYPYSIPQEDIQKIEAYMEKEKLFGNVFLKVVIE